MTERTASISLEDFQALIRQMYFEKDVARGIDGTFMWLMEEVGELAAALREGTREEQAAEFADVLAWLTTIANVAGVDLADGGAAEIWGRLPRLRTIRLHVRRRGETVDCDCLTISSSWEASRRRFRLIDRATMACRCVRAGVSLLRCSLCCRHCCGSCGRNVEPPTRIERVSRWFRGSLTRSDIGRRCGSTSTTSAALEDAQVEVTVPDSDGVPTIVSAPLPTGDDARADARRRRFIRRSGGMAAPIRRCA